MKKEVWKDIKRFEGVYQVSNLGRVKSLDREVVIKNKYKRSYKSRIKKSNYDKNGYKILILNREGEKINKKIHRLVAEAFIPNPDNKPEVNHINGIKDDNRVENLEWVTSSENTQHALKNKLLPTGEKHYNNRLTTKQVQEIHYLAHNSHLSQTKISNLYKVSRKYVSELKISKKWEHLKDNYDSELIEKLYDRIKTKVVIKDNHIELSFREIIELRNQLKEFL